MFNRSFLRLTSLALAASMLVMTGCEQQISESVNTENESEIVVTTAPETEAVEYVAALGINSNVLPSIAGVTVDDAAEELAPVNLTVGVINSVVRDLQQRLMDLGYMDPDEPTTYYGDATSLAVQYFQRQAGMAMDGICGVETWDAIMSDNAPHYALKLGFQGNDVTHAQYRLYNLGYLYNASDINGTYDETTMEAVKKLQEMNGLTVDGIYGTSTYNLLYSDEVKANIVALGEQSDLVKKYQQILINLGYLEGEADGNFGLGTQNAIKAFQSRNDQVVDGYLGPDTRAALDDPNAIPYAMRLGEQSDSVKELQEYLVKYGYLDSDKATGYFGELTKSAVANFQSKNGLTADGLAGAKTITLLHSGNVKKNTKQSSTSQSSSGTTGNTTVTAPANTGGNSGSAAVQIPQTAYVGNGGETVSGSAANLIAIASSKIGCPYVWGAKGPNSFDCSGFVYWCLNQAGVGVSYMTSSGWRNPGRFKQVSYNELQAGDIIVVSGHVGIVAGGGTIIDASSSNGRVVHRNLGAWWANHFICGWRIFS
ncbi:Peptidoglycan-binding (PGRP) domain of peptidoglycan hydrolases-containing protein [Oribacterium sp. KHPX15]|uniref:C40 family peptidase n=1 Tax=unclassified Oribacterium TaxID=2629782 RepID=UPI0004E26062|nr:MULTISPECIES: peptidoglycan-binding protein [unclassified Oribacterium]SEA14505.1 Peptidoglycan-binding (PGRP) domain of peptidoglycan hydrolases-containing protein [Oribacterium sp. KHPX15]